MQVSKDLVVVRNSAVHLCTLTISQKDHADVTTDRVLMGAETENVLHHDLVAPSAPTLCLQSMPPDRRLSIVL